MTDFSLEEVQLAARNHGMPLEALRYDVTPVGMHYLLTHYDIPFVDSSSWRLELGGLVDTPLSLSIDDLRARDALEVTVTMECAGNGRARLAPRPFSQPWVNEAIGTARWRGVRLRDLLDEAGLGETVCELVFTGLDRGVEDETELLFERSLPAAEARRDEVLLAYAINDQPLPPQHGAPLRLVVPGWYGMTNVKWLQTITAVDEPFTGYQQVRAYTFRADEDDPGRPLDRMLPRALMIPPGVPDFPTRSRFLAPGPCMLEGRAWSGFAPIATVEVSTDGGKSWSEAEVEDAESPWAWRGWRFRWDADPGTHELRCRTQDAEGNAQPDEPEWNVGGYTNNAVQRVPVTVT